MNKSIRPQPQEAEFVGLVRQYYRRAGPERAQALLDDLAECPDRQEMIRLAQRAVESLPTLH